MLVGARDEIGLCSVLTTNFVDVLYVQQLIIAQCHPLANISPHDYSGSMNCQSNGASHQAAICMMFK